MDISYLQDRSILSLFFAAASLERAMFLTVEAQSYNEGKMKSQKECLLGSSRIDISKKVLP